MKIREAVEPGRIGYLLSTFQILSEIWRFAGPHAGVEIPSSSFMFLSFLSGPSSFMPAWTRPSGRHPSFEIPWMT